MNNRILSLALIFVTALLGACASTVTVLPDGQRCLGAHTAGGIDRSSTYVALYECRNEGGKLVVGKEIKPGDMVHGQTVAGQAIVGAVGGTGAALINGNTARAVARIGQCPAGSVCPGATVITNQVQSVAEALNENKVRIGVEAGSIAPATPACAATNTCGK